MRILITLALLVSLIGCASRPTEPEPREVIVPADDIISRAIQASETVNTHDANGTRSRQGARYSIDIHMDNEPGDMATSTSHQRGEGASSVGGPADLAQGSIADHSLVLALPLALDELGDLLRCSVSRDLLDEACQEPVNVHHQFPTLRRRSTSRCLD